MKFHCSIFLKFDDWRVFCGILSFAGLFITLTIYSWIPEFKNLHGRIVLNNIFSIGLTEIHLGLTLYLVLDEGSIACTLVGFYGYFSFISMFMWMSVMSLDLYLTFSKPELSSNRSDTIKILFYSAIGWGIPVLMTILLVAFHYCANHSSVLYPGVGDSKCFFNGSYSDLIFFYIPVMMILLTNLLIFSAMILKLVLAKLETRNVRSTARHNSDFKDQLVCINFY